MPPLERVDRSTLTPFNPGPLMDPNGFMLAITIVIEYINFGNTRQEVVQLRDVAQSWCERYYSTPQFARHELDRVLKHHPNMFNFSIISRARLDPLPTAAANTNDDDDGDGDDTAMDVNGFPTYIEPSLFDDNALYELLDIVAARQQQLQQVHNEDRYAHLRPQVSAASLKETHIIWNLPGVMASLARLNIAALDDGTGFPMFVDPPAPTAAAGTSMNADAGAAPAPRASEPGSDMLSECGSDCDCMSVDGTPDEDADAELLEGTSSEDAELSDDSFLTAESGGTFHTARTSPEVAGLEALTLEISQMDLTAVEDAAAEKDAPGEALALDDSQMDLTVVENAAAKQDAPGEALALENSQMDSTVVEDAAAEQNAPGEAMEGVEEPRYPVLRGYFAMIRRKMEEARLRAMNEDAENMS